MEVTTENYEDRSDQGFVAETESKIKQKFGAARRRIKQIDLRGTIVAHPFPAVGIALAAGALIGLARPMPKRGRISSAVTGLATALAFRYVKGIAMAQLGSYAKDFLRDQFGNRGEEPVSGTDAKFAPPF